MKTVSLLMTLILFFTACSDDATVIKHEKSLTQLPCMRLVVFPPDKLISQTLQELYPFDDNCTYKLEVSRKSQIVCNSNQNAPQKALSNFPNSYLRLDLYKGQDILYSYYKDLTREVTQDDISNAFKRLQKDFTLTNP